MNLKKMKKYYSKNVSENSIVHLIIGMGIGFLLTYPMAGPHPVRWGLAFITVGLVWHLKAGK